MNLNQSFGVILLLFWLCSDHGIECKKIVNNGTYLLSKPECTVKRQKQLEHEMAQLLPFGEDGRKFPLNYDEVLAYCRDINRIVSRSESFLKGCFQKSIVDYATILIYTAKKNLRKYCGKRGSRVVRDLLKLGPCANKYIRTSPQPMACLNRFMNQTAQLINIKQDRIKIPHACCYYVDGIKCAEEFLSSVPCIRTQLPILMDYFRSGTEAISEIMCGEYNDQSDACSKLGKAPTPEKRNKTKYFMPVSLFIDLLESIHDFNPSPQFTGL